MSGSGLSDHDSPPEREAAAADGAMAAQSRTLRNSIISLAVFFGLTVGLLLAVPGLRAAGKQITHANVGWVLVGIVLELLSCLGYVMLFDLVFGSLARSLTSRLSLAELAVNSVVSVSGLAGIALGAWVLRTRGFPIERIARRSVLIFVLTSAVNVGAVAIIGTLMWLGIVPGTQDPLLTLLPAAAAVLTIVVTLGLAEPCPPGGGGAGRLRRPDGGGPGRDRGRGAGRARPHPPARPEAVRGGRLLAVRQPRAAGHAGRLRGHARPSGWWRWPTSSG